MTDEEKKYVTALEEAIDKLNAIVTSLNQQNAKYRKDIDIKFSNGYKEGIAHSNKQLMERSEKVLNFLRPYLNEDVERETKLMLTEPICK